jgi:hypothetical protein
LQWSKQLGEMDTDHPASTGSVRKPSIGKRIVSVDEFRHSAVSFAWVDVEIHIGMEQLGLCLTERNGVSTM